MPNPTVKFASLRWDCAKAQPLTFTLAIMKNNWALSLSAILYILLGIIFLIGLPIKNSPPNGTVIGVAIFLAAFCFYLGNAAFRARTGTFIQKRNFGIAASIFCGGVAGISGLSAGIVLGIPWAIGLLGIREIWWRGKVKANPAFKRDALKRAP